MVAAWLPCGFRVVSKILTYVHNLQLTLQLTKEKIEGFCPSPVLNRISYLPALLVRG